MKKVKNKYALTFYAYQCPNCSHHFIDPEFHEDWSCYACNHVLNNLTFDEFDSIMTGQLYDKKNDETAYERV